MLKDTSFREIQELKAKVAKLEAIAEDTCLLLNSQDRVLIRFKRLDLRASLPVYKNPGDAGADVCACLPDHTPSMTIFEGATIAVPLGFAVEIPDGYEIQVRSRSSLAKKGIAVANGVGTVDAGYRGEMMVLLHNTGGIYTVHHGDRIAQLVVARVTRGDFVEVQELSESVRGESGFGSTGQ